jgi:hypothetical protein
MAKAKYGLFYAANEKPAQVIEGDRIEHVGEVVTVYEGKDLVGVFRLGDTTTAVRKVN